MIDYVSLEGLISVLVSLEANGFGVPKDKIKLCQYVRSGGSGDDGIMTEEELVSFRDNLNVLVVNGFSSLKDEIKAVNYLLDGAV